MCTMVMRRAAVDGSAKGGQGWFGFDHVYTGYDHPTHLSAEHALTLDFVDEAAGPGARVAVELSRDAARAVAEGILAALDEGAPHDE